MQIKLEPDCPDISNSEIVESDIVIKFWPTITFTESEKPPSIGYDVTVPITPLVEASPEIRPVGELIVIVDKPFEPIALPYDDPEKETMEIVCNVDEDNAPPAPLPE